MATQPGQHILAQGLRLKHDGIGPMAGDVARQPVGGFDVELDHLACAAGQLPRSRGL